MGLRGQRRRVARGLRGGGSLIPADQAELVEEIRAGFDDAVAVLDPYRKGDGFVLYTDLTEQDTTTLAQTIDTLAEPLSQVAAIVVAP